MRFHTIPLAQIHVPKGRYRQHFDKSAIRDLADSILAVGLINLPVCRQEEGKLVVVAGERRLRAIQMIYEWGKRFHYAGLEVPDSCAPIVLNTELEGLAAKELELDENIRRADLTWQERACAVANLHQLRLGADPNWTLTKTAVEVEERAGTKISPTVVSDRVLLAENLHRPSVAKAKSEKEAYKKLKRELEEEFLTEMGRRSKPLQSMDFTITEADAEEGCMSLPAKSIDVVVMDPPYGIGADKFGVEDCTWKHKYTDSEEEAGRVLQRVIAALDRPLKDEAHIYIFCDFRRAYAIQEVLDAYGWDVWPKPLIWVKDQGHLPRPHHGPRYMYEMIIYALRGDKLTTALYPDVITCPIVKDKVHAAQKPVDLYVDLLKRSTRLGDKVLDPFCGSGTIFPAAAKLNLKAVGFDNDPKCVQLSRERILNAICTVPRPAGC